MCSSCNGNNWWWIIILILLAGGFSNNDCGCGCNNDCGCNGNNWVVDNNTYPARRRFQQQWLRLRQRLRLQQQ